MKMTYIFLILFALLSLPVFATANEANIKKLKQLGRKNLIRLAAEKVRSGDNTFNPENFDRIKVLASNHTLYVSFDMSFKYVPQNSTYKYDVSVDLYKSDNNSEYQILPSITSCIESNPKGYISKKESGFYSPTEVSRKAIDFVLNTMNRAHKDGFYAKKTWPWDHEMIIRDKNDHYEIEERHPATIGYYSIKKKSGKIYEEGHMHLIENSRPIELEGFEEKFEEIEE
jgi:hypothetical protein